MYSVITDHPLALDSLDHIDPKGTMLDHSSNPKFNEKLYALMGGRSLRVMDLGCSGGNFIEDCLRDGHEAVGLEGSDYSQIRGREAWGRIPDNLFTCDISRPFQVTRDGTPALFDVITAWEVMEHIPEERLLELCANIKKHMTPDARFIGSISPIGDSHHPTIHSQEWWMEVLGMAGFVNYDAEVEHFGGFNGDAWVRSNLRGAPYSFPVVLSLAGSSAAPSS